MSRPIGAILLTLCLSCQAPRPQPVVNSEDVDLKIIAMKQAAAKKDLSVAPQMVDNLESDDAAVRLAAITALEKLAGERFGYEYYMDADQRKPSMARWREWLKGLGNK